MHPWRNWIAHQIPILTVGGSSPPGCTIKTHAKGAYKTPMRVSFSMQNRGKLPFLSFLRSSPWGFVLLSLWEIANR